MQRFKSWILPIAIVLGIFFHEYIIVLQPALPYFIFVMLYFSFNSLDVKTMRFTMFDFWLLAFQLVVSSIVYFAIRPFDEVIAQGAFVTVLAPTAAAAIAVSLILGANIGMMSTYLIACNLMVAMVAPLSFTLIGASPDISFWSSFLAILGKVFPLLIAPFLLAVLTRWLLPKVNGYINRHKNLSFYVWAVSLTVVISRAIGLLLTQFHEHYVPLDGGHLHFLVFPAVFCGTYHWSSLRRPHSGRTGFGTEKHGAGHLDGAELPESLMQHRSHLVCHLAEPLQQFPDDAKGKGHPVRNALSPSSQAFRNVKM